MSAVLSQVYGNDTTGDCTEACSYHLLGLRQANAGITPFIPTLDQVLAVYSRDSGYVVGQPATDNGVDEITVLDNAVTLGLAGGDKLSGYLLIDATNRDLVRAASSIFVGLSCCVNLPDAWDIPIPSTSSFKWDVAGPPNPINGHCFAIVDQSDSDLTICTWGLTGSITYDAVAKYAVLGEVGALYVLIDKNVLASGKLIAPDGLDWVQLEADFAALGGYIES